MIKRPSRDEKQKQHASKKAGRGIRVRSGLRAEIAKWWSDHHSATASPPMARCTSLSAWSAPLPSPLAPTLRGPRPGCLTPNAAPSILLPGSPILGGPSACIDELSSVGVDTADWMRSFNVGWEGRFGSVGDGSRPPFRCSGMAPLVLTWDRVLLCPLRKVLPLAPPLRLPLRVGKTEMEAARLLCPRDGLLTCWPRALTVCITVCASGPSYGRMVALMPVDAEVRTAGGNAIVLRYARFAGDVKSHQHRQYIRARTRHTNGSVLEDDQEASVVLPLDLEATAGRLIL